MESLLTPSDTNVDISALPVSGDSTRSHSGPRPDEGTDTLLAPRRSVSFNSKCSHGTQRALKERPWFFEWRWEIGSILVSVICMSLIAGILFSMNGKPTRMWKLPIQPNSLVAVFSTVAKSALLVPIAESIGQLKWGYFKRSRPLVHMQALDEASRGPWGAITLLWITRGTSLLTASGAIITILLLTFEPFTQQVIEIKNQRAILTNTSGFVSTTNMFSMGWRVRQDPTQWLPRELGLAMTTGILDAISGQPVSLKGNSHCPTLECGLEDFTSLAVCAFCESEEVELGKSSNQCSYDIQEGYSLENITWQYGSPEILTNQSILGPIYSYSEFTKAVSELDESSVLMRSCSFDVGSDAHINLTFQIAPQRWVEDTYVSEFLRMHSNDTRELLKLPYIRGMSLSWGATPENLTIGADVVTWVTGTGKPPLFSLGDSQYLEEGMLSACALEQDPPSMNPGFYNTPDNIARFTCFTSSSNITTMEQLDRFGEINGTVTRCRPTLCARQFRNVTITPAGMRAGSTTDFPLINIAISDNDSLIAYDKFNNTFFFAPDLNFLPRLFRYTTSSDIFIYLLSTYLPKTGNDWEQLLERMSEVLTQVMQNPVNPNTTRLYGPAYGAEVFIGVQWTWFIMPLLLVLASIIFLAMTIYRSRKSSYLFKNSALAVLFHGLNDSEKQKVLHANVSKKQTYEGLTTEAGTIRVSFWKDEDGILRLKKEV